MSSPVKPTEPEKKTKYLDIGTGYVNTVDSSISESATELGSRIEIVPYNKFGERDTLGLNTIECLKSISDLLTEAQGCYDGYEAICQKVDQEVYDEEYEAYLAALDEYNSSLQSTRTTTTSSGSN